MHPDAQLNEILISMMSSSTETANNIKIGTAWSVDFANGRIANAALRAAEW